jgi:hypothetical protein
MLMLWQIGEVVTTIPTIGFNVESVTYKNLNFNVWVRHPFSRQRLSKFADRSRILVAKQVFDHTGAVTTRIPQL